MSNINNILIQALGYATNANGINAYTSQNSAYPTIAGNASFAAILNQLNKNLDNPQISASSGFGGSVSTNMGQTGVTPSIDAILQKIKENDNNTLGIDEQVSQYLLDNYGGNKADVIRSISGAQSLPVQMTALQDPIFQTIVAKLSTQVRNSIYSGQDLSMDSDNTDVDSSDSSIESEDINS